MFTNNPPQRLPGVLPSAIRKDRLLRQNRRVTFYIQNADSCWEGGWPDRRGTCYLSPQSSPTGGSNANSGRYFSKYHRARVTADYFSAADVLPCSRVNLAKKNRVLNGYGCPLPLPKMTSCSLKSCPSLAAAAVKKTKPSAKESILNWPCDKEWKKPASLWDQQTSQMLAI